jgi:hypothetical protein
MARATQVKINVPIMFYPFANGLWVQCQKVATIPTSRTVCRKNVSCKNVTLQTQMMQGESAQYLSNRLAKATSF